MISKVRSICLSFLFSVKMKSQTIKKIKNSKTSMGESWQIFCEFKGSRDYMVSSRPELHEERRKNKEERRRKRGTGNQKTWVLDSAWLQASCLCNHGKLPNFPGHASAIDTELFQSHLPKKKMFLLVQQETKCGKSQYQ